jgi:hypothetical protein
MLSKNKKEEHTMKRYLNSRSIGSLLIPLGLLTLLSCGKNNDANSQAQAADLSKTQNQGKGKSSSQARFAPKSADDAIDQAQQNGDFLCVQFYEKKDDTFKQMRKTVQVFSKNSAKTIRMYDALTTDGKETEAIQKYGINRAPLPVLLVFAPNGAVTGGFPQKVTEEQLSSSMVPKLIMDILKTVQARKIALVLLQNSKTKYNAETALTADEFARDPRLNGYVDIIKQDPSDEEIKDFLKQCNIANTTEEAATVLVVPPGQIGGVYSGKTTKNTLIAGLASCSSGCGSGCGPK